MRNLSQNQLIRLWSELEQCYYRDNGYGGNVAEIYAYTLHQHNPSMIHETMREKATEESGIEAATSLREVCRIFAEKRDCVITVECRDGWLPLEFYLPVLIHRVHVKVLRRAEPEREDRKK